MIWTTYFKYKLAVTHNYLARVKFTHAFRELLMNPHKNTHTHIIHPYFELRVDDLEEGYTITSISAVASRLKYKQIMSCSI